MKKSSIFIWGETATVYFREKEKLMMNKLLNHHLSKLNEY
jgi:hypothetical protein